MSALRFCTVTPCCFTALASTNVTVEGVVMRDSCRWTMLVRNGSEGITFDNVKVIGTPIDAIERGEGRDIFKQTMNELGIEMAAEMIAKIKDEKLCDGVHIMAIGAEKNVPTILEKAGIEI